MIRTASKTAATSKEKTFYFSQYALNGEYNRSKLKKKDVFAQQLLTLNYLHYSTKTYSRVRNFGNNHTLKQGALKKKENSLTAAWVAPQVGLLSKDMWKEMKDIASL